jgi:hypothetical protein
MSKIKAAEIEEGKRRIEDLEKQVEAAKVETAAAFHGVNVQVRYASRVQSAIRSNPPSEGFITRMEALIDADKLATQARGK